MALDLVASRVYLQYEYVDLQYLATFYRSVCEQFRKRLQNAQTKTTKLLQILFSVVGQPFAVDSGRIISDHSASPANDLNELQPRELLRHLFKAEVRNLELSRSKLELN